MMRNIGKVIHYDGHTRAKLMTVTFVVVVVFTTVWNDPDPCSTTNLQKLISTLYYLLILIRRVLRIVDPPDRAFAIDLCH